MRRNSQHMLRLELNPRETYPTSVIIANISYYQPRNDQTKIGVILDIFSSVPYNYTTTHTATPTPPWLGMSSPARRPHRCPTSFNKWYRCCSCSSSSYSRMSIEYYNNIFVILLSSPLTMPSVIVVVAAQARSYINSGHSSATNTLFAAAPQSCACTLLSVCQVVVVVVLVFCSSSHRLEQQLVGGSSQRFRHNFSASIRFSFDFGMV